MDLNIIPTVAWGKEEDLTWCFEGFPTNSSIAISTNGCKSEPYSKKLFLLGVEELQTKLTPFKEALINCEKRINQCHPINPLSFDKLPYNHNLRQLEKVAGTAVKCSPSFNQRFLKLIICGSIFEELKEYDNIVQYNSFSQRLAIKLKEQAIQKEKSKQYEFNFEFSNETNMARS